MPGLLQQPLKIGYEDHAFLSPSNYHWVNYNREKLKQVWNAKEAAKLGTRLHILAAELISLGVKLDTCKYPTLATYVNDCIDFGMYPEVHVECDMECFGTADALLFKHNVLHIWDLKTGANRVHHTQVSIYAAIFCLERGIDPMTIQYDLRIYQNNEVKQVLGHPEYILKLMNTIVEDLKIIAEEKKIARY